MKTAKYLTPFLAYIVISIGLAAQVTVDSSGEVGIGTSSPREKLHVAGIVLAGDNPGGATQGNLAFGIAYNGDNIINTIGSQYSSAATTIGYSVKPKSGAVGYVSSMGNYATRGSIELTNELIFRNASHATVAMGSDVTMTERFRVNSDGEVGIGVSSPARKLEVAGPTITGGPLWDSEAIRASSTGHSAGLGIDGSGTHWGATIFQDGARRFVLESNGGALLGAGFLRSNAPANGLLVEGNVGIGTTSPGSKLETNGTIRATGYATPTTNGGGLELSYSGGAGIVESYNRGSGGTPLYVYGYPTAMLGGNVGIGTNSPAEKLQVVGTIRATSFISDTTTYADFVFDEGYKLQSLEEVETHIEQHGHLPDIPSEAEAMANGIDIASMQVRLLQKIEELTLHTIRQEKSLNRLSADNQFLQDEVQQLKEQVR